MELISKAINLAVENVDVILSTVGLFALIATRTPNKVDNKIAQVLMDLVNFLGANVDKAKNSE